MTIPAPMVNWGTSEIAKELTTESLTRLADRKLAAIHVSGYYPADVAAEVAQEAIRHPELENYKTQRAGGVGRVHLPHFDVRWNEGLSRRYHDGAIESVRDVRAMFHPYLAPVDQLRLDLEELWPAGANLMRLHGRPCFVGAFRVFNPDTSEFAPHNDAIDQETDAPEIEGIVNQLVANIYLQVPKRGGTLQLWTREPTAVEVEILRESAGLNRDLVGPPDVEISPASGDMVLFSSRMLHAVTVAEGDHRVGAAAFIASKGLNHPLTYWS
ncbi:2OG-Fe(II) oxygenase [Micromonospora sp. NPDC005172]|uniref:2OG-Fe(II) oxygenase n=1 Tax=Micromonospora sp. NPDC005172 TaxID=3156867 RepID=UPI0033B50EFD